MVTIVPTYTPPPDVDLGPNEYRAATTLTLTCIVGGATGTVSYQWTSSFENNLITQSITRDQLRPQENGTHTCTATDGDGDTGSGSIEVIVVGELS